MNEEQKAFLFTEEAGPLSTLITAFLVSVYFSILFSGSVSYCYFGLLFYSQREKHFVLTIFGEVIFTLGLKNTPLTIVTNFPSQINAMKSIYKIKGRWLACV